MIFKKRKSRIYNIDTYKMVQFNLKNMGKRDLYSLAKQLAQRLGKDVSNFKDKHWGITSKPNLKKLVRNYKKQTNKLDNKEKKIKELSKLTGVAVSENLKYTKSSLDTEIKRLQNKKRTKEVKEYMKNYREEKILSLQDDIILSAFTVNTIQLVNGSTRREFIHTVPDGIRQRLNDDNLNNIKKQIIQVLKVHKQSIVGKRVKIMVEDTRTGNVISSSYLINSSEALERLMKEQLGPKAREYDDDTFEIGRITIAIFIPPNGVMGSSNSRSIQQANAKWHIINPKSRFNCVFQSIVCCRNFLSNKDLILDTEEASKKRIRAGKNLKEKIKPSNDNYADNMTIQEIADWTKYPINLYDNIFKLIKTFKPKKPLERYKTPIKHYDIQKLGDHCLALIDKKLIKSKYPDFNFNVIEKVEEVEEQENTPIEKKMSFEEYNSKIAAWDIETSPNGKGEHIPYACSIAWFNYEYGEDTITIVNKKVRKKKITSIKQVEKRTKNIIKSTPEEKQFWGLDCLQRMTTYIHDNKERFNGYTLYAHNGGKYDLPLAIKKAFMKSPEFLIEGQGCVELNNAWIGFQLRSKNDRKFKLYFRDSLRLLPMGLAKLTKELKVPHQKLTETINHKDITLINYNTFPALKTYLTHDVFGLLEVIQKFGQGVFNDLGIDITNCYTGASLSKKNFFKNYYNTKFQVYKLSDDNDDFIRKSYFGGRVECFQMGEVDKCYYYDFTSLYPDVGRNYLPYGEPEIVKFNKSKELPKSKRVYKGYYRVPFNIDCFVKIVKGVYLFQDIPEYNPDTEPKDDEWYEDDDNTKRLNKRINSGFYKESFNGWHRTLDDFKQYERVGEDFFGWVECLVRTKNTNHIPKHAVIKDGRLIFPIFENWTTITIFSEELDYNQYEYEFIKGIKFNKSRIKQRFFNDGFRNKAKAKAEGNPAMAQAYKIIINSGYGFWGLKTKDRDGIIICEPNSHKYMDYLNTDKLVSIREQGDYVLCRIKKDLDVCDFNVSVAAAISSYARSKLHSMLTEIRKVGGKVYYCDTDSVICNININDYPNIKKKFQWDGDGTELGSLKNECDEYIEKIVKKEHPEYTKEQINKELKILSEKENGNFSFDKGIITGCKQYALQKKLQYNGKEHIIEIVKLKGYSQREDNLKFSDMESLNSGIGLKQKQTQFRCPKSSYVSETTPFTIKSKVVEKSFRKTYTKGQIFGKYVLPHRI